MTLFSRRFKNNSYICSDIGFCHRISEFAFFSVSLLQQPNFLTIKI